MGGMVTIGGKCQGWHESLATAISGSIGACSERWGWSTKLSVLCGSLRLGAKQLYQGCVSRKAAKIRKDAKQRSKEGGDTL